MIEVTTPQSPFTVGDRVMPVESADDSLALWGRRSDPGVIRTIKGGTHLVAFSWTTVALPYPSHELEKAP